MSQEDYPAYIESITVSSHTESFIKEKLANDGIETEIIVAS